MQDHVQSTGYYRQTNKTVKQPWVLKKHFLNEYENYYYFTIKFNKLIFVN